MSRLLGRLKYACVCGGVGLCSLMWVSSVYADNCDNLDKNSVWTSEFTYLNDAYKKEDWKTALKHAKKLEEICEISPVLNYTMARIYKNSGDKEKYLYYLLGKIL